MLEEGRDLRFLRIQQPVVAYHDNTSIRRRITDVISLDAIPNMFYRQNCGLSAPDATCAVADARTLV